MRIVFGILLTAAVCGEYTFALPVQNQQIVRRQLDRMPREFDTYISILSDEATNNKIVDLEVEEVQINNNKVRGPQDATQAAHLLRTRGDRNKRYISYLTLCHFKICNFGRKRSKRYFQMIRLDDNEA